MMVEAAEMEDLRLVGGLELQILWVKVKSPFIPELRLSS